MDTVAWLRGHPAILIGRNELAAYPGDGVGGPSGGPVAAYVWNGEGYQALVVHDPESTTFLPTPTGGVLAQLICADDWTAAPEHLRAHLPVDGWTDLGEQFHCGGDGAVLFDANYAGRDLADPAALAGMKEMGVTPIDVALPKGRYELRAQVGLKVPADAEWTLIELRRVGN